MKSNWSKSYFHDEQYKIWNLNFKRLVMMWGRGSGKTELAIHMALRELQKPNKLVWIVAPTQQSVVEIYSDRIIWLLIHMYKWEEHIRWDTSERSMCFTFYNPEGNSTLLLKSSDKQERLEGRRVNLVILDEFAKFSKQNIFESTFFPTLSPAARLIIISTPKGYNPYWYLAQKAKKDKTGLWAYSEATSFCNDKYYELDDSCNPPKKITWKEKIIEDSKDMPMWQWKQEYMCEVTAQEGRCLPEFNKEYNSIKLPFDYFPDIPIYITMDFNRSPMFWIVAQKVKRSYLEEKYPEIIEQWKSKLEKHPDITGLQDEIVFYLKELVYNEMHMDKMMPVLDNYLDNINFNPDVNGKLIFTGDSTGGQKTVHSGKSAWQFLKEHYSEHIFNVKTNPSPFQSITTFGRKVRNAKNEIGILNNENNTNIFEHIEGAVWKEGSWDIDKYNFDPHGLDACRYLTDLLYTKIRTRKFNQTQNNTVYLDILSPKRQDVFQNSFSPSFV